MKTSSLKIDVSSYTGSSIDHVCYELCMLDEGKPDIVIAFPGGNGTKDMIKRARFEGVPVVEVK